MRRASSGMTPKMHKTPSVSLPSAEMFTKRDLEGETKGQWYLRQMLCSSNIDAGPVWRS